MTKFGDYSTQSVPASADTYLFLDQDDASTGKLNQVAHGQLFGSNHVRVEQYGAVGDGVTDDTAAIAAAIAATPTRGVLEFSPGLNYLVTGDLAVDFNKEMTIIFNKATLTYKAGQTGTLVKVSAPGVTMRHPILTRAYTADGSIPAATALVGTGLWLANQARFRAYNPKISGFKHGLKAQSEAGGCSYTTIYDLVAQDNFYNIFLDAPDTVGAYTTDFKFYGGLLATYASKYSNTVGVHLVHIGQTSTYHAVNGIEFYGVTIEQLGLDRKVYCAGDTAQFFGCYWDAGAFDTGKELGTETNWSSTGGSAVIDKGSAHGYTLTVNDLILITDATTSADEGFYRVVSAAANTITLDRKLSGTDADVDFIVYRTDIEFTDDADYAHLIGGNNLWHQAIVMMGEYNRIDDPRLGMLSGYSKFPYGGYGLTSATKGGLMNLMAQYSGNFKMYWGNLADHATAADLQLDVLGLDSGGRERSFAAIKFDKAGRGNDFVAGRMEFHVNDDAGLYGTRAKVAIGSDGTVEFSPYTTGRVGGTLKLWTHQSDTFADDATLDLPDATDGILTISATWAGNAEGGTIIIGADGECNKAGATTNLEDSDTGNDSGDICVYDNGTKATIINRTASTVALRAFYYYN